MKRNVIAGLDLGTTKVCAVIAEQVDNHLNILGFGVAPSEGLNRGLVANISKTAEAITDAMNIATNRAGLTVKELNVGVAGEHITSLRHRNYVTINNPEREITEQDLERLRADVQTIRIPSDRQILHIIPEEYSVDHQGGIDDPIGMCGSRLEAVNHVVLASIPAIQNIKKSVERAGYTVKDYVLQPIASSFAVLDENEKDLGVLLIDIGGGTTDIAVIKDGSIYHTSVLPVAGNQVTHDISVGLGLSFELAEEMKKKYATVMPSEDAGDKEVPISGDGHSVSSRDLSDIVYARMEELIRLIVLELPRNDYNRVIPAGIVLTGGTANLPGIAEMAQQITKLPVRLGIPVNLYGVSNNMLNDPAYATSAGLLLWKMRNDGVQRWPTENTGIRRFFSQIIRLFQ